ncbi:MAG: DUF1653 domain-containing protein [Lachnospiraceae bacterium]|nr:DUF1653 domain-containing protein [Lachnospiraceae bacterium]
MERKAPVPGEIYKHFKNKLYQIVGIATYSESREKLVIYQALYGTYAMYARPYDMFMSEVDHKKYPEVKQRYRFERVGRAGEEPDAAITEVKPATPENASIQISPDLDQKPNADLLAFLDAETYDEKHKLLVAMAPRITDRLINDIAAAIDVTVEEGDLQTRYRSLLYCVSKFNEYEVNRLR